MPRSIYARSQDMQSDADLKDERGADGEHRADARWLVDICWPHGCQPYTHQAAISNLPDYYGRVNCSQLAPPTA